MDVYVLQHVHEFDDESEDIKLLGIYSSAESADAAVRRLSAQPGFRDNPEGFRVDRYTVDRDHWTEGFVTIPRTRVLDD